MILPSIILHFRMMRPVPGEFGFVTRPKARYLPVMCIRYAALTVFLGLVLHVRARGAEPLVQVLVPG